MVQQTVEQIRFDFFSRLPIDVEVRDVQVSSDAGILPIRQFDDQIGYTDRFIACLNDVRDAGRISHPAGHMLRQRLYGIIAGYEESENRNKELKEGVIADRLSCHRFMANYFRLHMHAAALNLMVRLRRVVADPPALTGWDKPHEKQVPVADPTQPIEALQGQDRRRYHNYRRRLDPLGEGHLSTWRTMLIKVAGEVVQSVRRLRLILPASWPHLQWFVHACQRIAHFRPTGAQAAP